MQIWVNCESCSQRVAVMPLATKEASCPGCGHAFTLPDGHDVFVSYTTPDLEVAKKVCSALHARKLNYWLAPKRIKSGDFFARVISEHLKKSRVFVLILSEAATKSPWVTRELTDAISSRMVVLPFKIQQFELSDAWRHLLGVIQWQEAYRGSIENNIELLISRVEESLCALSVATPVSSSSKPEPIEPKAKRGVNPLLSPYIGPQPFTHDKMHRFFSRQHDAEQILSLITSHRIVLVYAPSGAGKSSLLNTRVYGSLVESGLEVLLGARVGGALPEGVKAAQIRNIFTFSVVYGLSGAAIPNVQCNLTDTLAMRHVLSGVRGRVIIFDQFEELFTQHTERFEDRKGFFTDVIEAMNADPELRIILALRQEYLADIDPLLAELPSNLLGQRFALRRLDLKDAREAIVGPAREFADFDEQVADELVRQLNTIRVKGFDGIIVEKRGEFIEMVHLQIVCQRLWASLPPGIMRIEKEHVEQAAGEGKKFSDFIVNALNIFYDDTLESVTHSRQTKEAGGYSKELIQLGCMKFVTDSATRTMIQRQNDRTGRLPNWIVDQLEKNHLLRCESRGGSQWYELSHDRLADPVARQINRDVSKLLFAADLLDAVLNRVKGEGRQDLKGYFRAHRDVLVECATFSKQVGLFEDEAEFVFRASLATGVDFNAWSRRMEQDFPAARQRVLTEALDCPDPAVRAHAATLLADKYEPTLAPKLVQLALADEDAIVRESAMKSLAKLDQEPLFHAIKSRFALPQAQREAKQASASLLVLSDLGKTGSEFAKFYASLGAGQRVAIRVKGWGLRFLNTYSVLPYVLIPAAVLSGFATSLYKWPLGITGYTLSQGGPNLMAGLFQGFTGGFIWGTTIPFCLMIHRLVFFRKTGLESSFRPLAALLWGGSAGFLTGALVSLMMAGVYEVPSLVVMGWIPNHDVKQFSAEYWSHIYLVSRLGWSYVITGCSQGVAMAIMGNGMKASGKIVDHNAHLSVLRTRELRTITLQIMKLALRYTWAFPLCLSLAAVIVALISQPGEGATPERASERGVLLATLSDCGSEWVGGYFSMVGVGIGIVLITRGIHLEPRKDEL